MTAIEEDNRTMMTVTRKTLAEAPAGLIASVPGALELVDAFLAALTIVEKNSEIQVSNIGGYAMTKAERRALMMGDTVSLCLSMKSYSISIRDEVLGHAMRWTSNCLITPFFSVR